MPKPNFARFAFCCLVLVACSAKAQERTVQLTVVDADSHEPLAARIYLESEAGRPYFFSCDNPEGTAVRYEKQNWINEDSVEYHTTVSAHRCTAQVPPGKYRLRALHGKSYFSSTRELDVSERDADVRVELRRWSNPAARRWYSGDTHLHRTVEELKNVLPAEDLNVALPLTYWVTRAGMSPSAGDKNQDAIPDGLVRIDERHVIWPRNTEYEISHVDGERHTLGALFVLGHREPLRRGVPPWRPAIEAAKGPQMAFDMDKLDWPFSMLLPKRRPMDHHRVAAVPPSLDQSAGTMHSLRPNLSRLPAGRDRHRRWQDLVLRGRENRSRARSPGQRTLIAVIFSPALRPISPLRG